VALLQTPPPGIADQIRATARPIFVTPIWIACNGVWVENCSESDAVALQASERIPFTFCEERSRFRIAFFQEDFLIRSSRFVVREDPFCSDRCAWSWLQWFSSHQGLFEWTWHPCHHCGVWMLPMLDQDGQAQAASVRFAVPDGAAQWWCALCLGFPSGVPSAVVAWIRQRDWADPAVRTQCQWIHV
jgi:hypothetical protein